jgi:hypothetical protein
MRAVVIALLLGLAMSTTIVRYSNDQITQKFYDMRDGAAIGGAANTELINHGAKVKVEFSVAQPSAGKFKNVMTYHLRNEDGTWKTMEVEYECREINMKNLCYGKTCPIAEYKPPTLPPNVQECMMVAKEATDVLQYMIENNPELTKNSASLKECIETKGKPDTKVEEICFNKAIGDMEKAKEELTKQGYQVVQGADGKMVWKKVLPTS